MRLRTRRDCHTFYPKVCWCIQNVQGVPEKFRNTSIVPELQRYRHHVTGAQHWRVLDNRTCLALPARVEVSNTRISTQVFGASSTGHCVSTSTSLSDRYDVYNSRLFFGRSTSRWQWQAIKNLLEHVSYSYVSFEVPRQQVVVGRDSIASTFCGVTLWLYARLTTDAHEKV